MAVAQDYIAVDHMCVYMSTQ